jgi:succinate dehydrogenase/fumarate reductase flavoprotein subunit
MAYRVGAEITGKEFPAPHYNIAKYPSLFGHGGVYTMHSNYVDAEGNDIHTHAMDPSMASAIHEGKGPIVWNFDSAPPPVREMIKEGRNKQATAIMQKRLGEDLSLGGKFPMIGDSSAGRGRGGIWITDTNCASSLPGLFAAGDGAGIYSEGLGGGWGLNRGMVTGTRAGIGAAQYASQIEKATIDEEDISKAKEVLFAPAERKGGFSPSWVTQLLQNTMMPYFILSIKHEKRLQAALTIVEFLKDHMVPKMRAKDTHELKMAHETRNMVLNAEMMLRASLFRTESRLSHYREDYPRRDDPAWLAWVKYKEDQGKMKLWKEPIPEEYWPDPSTPYEERYPVRFLGE